MTSIEITRPDPDTGGTRVVVDGKDLSHSLSDVEVLVHGADFPRVVLTPTFVRELRMCSDEANVVIAENVLDLLREQGWRGPDDGSAALALLAQGGITGTDADTALATLLTRLGRELVHETADMTDEERSAYLTERFGSDACRVAAVLAKDGAR